MNPSYTRRGLLRGVAFAAQTRPPYRTLGKTGLKLSALGFGCMISSDASVVEKAIDAGINYFDTSRDYQNGNNERMLGAAVKGKRDKVVISTKTAALDRSEATEDLEISLKTLGSDYIDIWMLHDRTRGTEIKPELIEVMVEARKQGKARFIGVSTHRGQADVIPAMIKTGVFDAVMVTYNFAMDAARTLPPIQSARRAGLGVIGMKLLAGSFRLDPATYDRVKAVTKKPGAASAALRWALDGDVLDTGLVSMVDDEELADNLKAVSSPFAPADGQLLAGYVDRYGPMYCRMCGQCDGSCVKGLPVADMQRALTYAEGYRQFPLARERYLRLGGQAACDCASCPVQCAFGVDVAQRVRRAQNLLA